MIVSGQLGHPGLARDQYFLFAQVACYCAAEMHMKNKKTITVWSIGSDPTTYYVNEQNDPPPPNASMVLEITK